MIICAGKSEQFDFAIPVGVGMIDVAMNLTKLCMTQNPKYLLFIGTAGSYGERKIFDIIESKAATNIENSFLIGGSYTPIDNLVSATDDVSRETLINSSNYITKNADIAKRYLEKGIHAENMEYFAVLKIAKSFGIPAGGLFCVTNYCDENGHEEFLKNQKEAMEKIVAHLNIKK